MLGIIPDFKNEVKQMHAITIIGCGDIGQRVAKRYQQQNRPVRGMVLSAKSAEMLQKRAIIPIQANLDDAETLKDTSYTGNSVFYFAAPPRLGYQDTRMANWLASLDSHDLPDKVILISTTAVYGDTGGDWITEKSETSPTTDRGKRRLDAERQLLAWGQLNSIDVVILRVPGIYGPGRLPRERLEKALPVLNESECGYTNRIHSEDLAMICMAAAEKANGSDIFNVSDGSPGTMTDWFNQVADFLSLPRPPQISMQQAEQEMSTGMLSYLKESRRIDSSKLISELKITFMYQTIEEGIPASIESELMVNFRIDNNNYK